MVKLAFLGDFCPSKEQEEEILRDNFIIDNNINKKLATSDYVFPNFEGVIVTHEGELPILKGGEHLRIQKDILKRTIAHPNIICCLANNHSYDFGANGLEQTIQNFTEQSMGQCGTNKKPNEHQPYRIHTQDQHIAIFNVAEGEEALSNSLRHSGVENLYSPTLEVKISEFKQKGYFCILVSHAGAEHLASPPPHIITRYKNLVDRGVKLVVGHHPHTIQGAELTNAYSIYYSLGNFIMEKTFWPVDARYGALLTVDIQKSTIAAQCLDIFEISRLGIKQVEANQRDAIMRNRNISLSNSSEIWDQYVLNTYSYTDKFSLIDALLAQHAKNYIRLYNTLKTITHKEAFMRYIDLNHERLQKDSNSMYFKIKKDATRVRRYLQRKIGK